VDQIYWSCKLESIRQRAVDAYASVVLTIFGVIVTSLTFDLLTSCKSYLQHIQINLNYRHLMFYGDKMAPKVWSGHGCNLWAFDFKI